MLFKKFEPTDVIYNTLITHPKYQFIINRGNVYINNEVLNESSDYWASVGVRAMEKHIPRGYISLYEYNINRDEKNHTKENPTMIYPFITKQGARTAFSTISTSDFADSSQFNFGDEITGSYPLSASINRVIVIEGDDQDVTAPLTFENVETYTESAVDQNKRYIRALKGALNDRIRMSPHYAYSSSLGDKGYQELNMICIPSIFYGSRIRPGSVNLKFYVTGSLIGELTDSSENGELIQTSNSLVAGVVLYDHGVCILTGSWNIDDNHTAAYDGPQTNQKPPKTSPKPAQNLPEGYSF